MQVAAVFGVVVRGFMEQCQVLARLFMQIIWTAVSQQVCMFLSFLGGQVLAAKNATA
jgi:hypothetical protein